MSSLFSISVPPRRSLLTGVLPIELQSTHTEELRVNIIQVRIKIKGEEEFHDIEDFRILAGPPADRNFRIDLDPFECRSYGLQLGCTRSFDYIIVARDQRLHAESRVAGFAEGVDPSEKIDYRRVVTPTRSTTFEPGQTVVMNTEKVGRHEVGLIDDEYVVEAEDGTPNDFGIFDSFTLNPPGAYLELGSQGYLELRGLHQTELVWSDSTVADPGVDPDLFAVHVRQTATRKHGWLFRSSLFVLPK